MKRISLLAIATLFAANTASAQVLLSDNFNGLAGGNSSLNFTSFPNWTVLSGTVDVVKSGDYSITCTGGSGSCIDLDGSTGQAGTIGTQTFFFGAGERFNLTFDMSGNQRGYANDSFIMRLVFGGNTQYANANATGQLSFSGAGLFSPTFTYQLVNVPSNQPWSTSSFAFDFVNAGQVSVQFATTGGDNVGPMLDNVSITKTPATNVVPEPSTYALMAAGLVAMGVVARRRRA